MQFEVDFVPFNRADFGARFQRLLERSFAVLQHAQPGIDRGIATVPDEPRHHPQDFYREAVPRMGPLDINRPGHRVAAAPLGVEFRKLCPKVCLLGNQAAIRVLGFEHDTVPWTDRRNRLCLPIECELFMFHPNLQNFSHAEPPFLSWLVSFLIQNRCKSLQAVFKTLWSLQPYRGWCLSRYGSRSYASRFGVPRPASGYIVQRRAPRRPRQPRYTDARSAPRLRPAQAP